MYCKKCLTKLNNSKCINCKYNNVSISSIGGARRGGAAASQQTCWSDKDIEKNLIAIGDLEGKNIDDALQGIDKKENIQVIITGDIMDSCGAPGPDGHIVMKTLEYYCSHQYPLDGKVEDRTKLDAAINEIKYKSYNIHNLYKIITNNYEVVLGNRELVKLKSLLYNIEASDLIEPSDPKNKEAAELFVKHFNDPSQCPYSYDNFIKINKNIQFKHGPKYKDKTGKEYTQCAKRFYQYMAGGPRKIEEAGSIVNHNDTFRFCFDVAFGDVGAPFIQYTIIHELLHTLNLKHNTEWYQCLLMADILLAQELNFTVDTRRSKDAPSLTTVEKEEKTKREKELKSRSEYSYYIIGCIFKKLFSLPLQESSQKSSEYIYRCPPQGDEFEDTDMNSYLSGLLYNLFTRDNTNLVKFIPQDEKDETYLLSHGGITKYALLFYEKERYKDTFKEIRKELKKEDSILYNEKHNPESKKTYSQFFPKISDLDDDNTNNGKENTFDNKRIKQCVDKCNTWYKELIKLIFDFNEKNPCISSASLTIEGEEQERWFAAYVYLIILGTEIYSKAALIDIYDPVIESTYPGFNNNFLSPIGGGIVTLSVNESINFCYSQLNKICYQLMGHKPLGVSTSYFNLIKNHKQVLVNLDISNSFTSDYAINDYQSKSYNNVNLCKLLGNSKIFINENTTKLTSIDNFTTLHPAVKADAKNLANILSVNGRFCIISNDFDNLQQIYCNSNNMIQTNFFLNFTLDLNHQKLKYTFSIPQKYTTKPPYVILYNGSCKINNSKQDYDCFVITIQNSHIKIIALLKDVDYTDHNVVLKLLGLNDITAPAAVKLEQKYLKYKQKYLTLVNKLNKKN